MASLSPINKCEIVASFRKAKDLRAAVVDIVALGIPKYDINATAELFSKKDDEVDSYYAVWVWIQNLGHVDGVTDILSHHGGENIHMDDRNEIHLKPEISYNLQAALNDPPKIFGTPRALMASHFAPDVKRDLLQRWAYDIRQQEIADDEGMCVKSFTDILGDIETALAKLNSNS